jgi:hypothetical protein
MMSRLGKLLRDENEDRVPVMQPDSLTNTACLFVQSTYKRSSRERCSPSVPIVIASLSQLLSIYVDGESKTE